MDNKYNLIDSYLMGEMSVKDQTEFENLLRNDSELMKEYLFRKNMNDAISEKDVMDLRDKLNRITNSSNIFKESKRKLLIITTLAAVFVGLTVISTLFFFDKSPNSNMLFEQYYTKYPSIVSARSINDSNKEKLFLESFLAYETDDYANAIFYMNQLLKKEDSNNLLLFYLAISELEQDKLKESEEHLKILIQNKKHIFWEQAHWYLALNYIKQDNISEAKEILHRIVDGNFCMRKEANDLLRKLN